MNPRIHLLFLVCALGLLLPTAVSRALFSLPSAEREKEATAVTRLQTGGDPIPEGADLITNWYSQDPQSFRKGKGIVSYYNLSVFGQNICTDYGDPYSPLNSPWASGPYTYQYRIRIPADYPYDVVRVELFDPDSINRTNPTTPLTIPHTNAAIQAGLPAITTGTCSTNRLETCVIDTGELTLVDNGTLTLEPINPFWLWRVDENRGAGSPPGNGSCGTPATYNEEFNTRTLFNLWYWHQYPDGTIVRQDLATYTGQVGGSRDDGSHDTDLRWVSPGATQSYDQPVFVPVDPGSSGNFEIDLTTETPGIIIDPVTGARYINLGITGQDGASENGFDIWAGPPNYVSTIASNVNDRNLQVLNGPGSHSAQGVEVTAVDHLLLNQYYQDPLDMPLVELDASYAGTAVSVSLFDSDAGAQPPITFTVNSIAQVDWSLVFAQDGVPDPDGGVRNCVPGSCNNLFITPPYTVTLPDDRNCDYANPDPQDCTPFYGGELIARYESGVSDTYLWEVKLPTPPISDPTAGCSAFPIIIHEDIRSVNPPNTPPNPFPNAGDFGNPNPPTYEQFINHVPNEPLLTGRPGYVYRIWNGFGDSNFGWLRWNEGLFGSVVNLTGSMRWPGNSLDYFEYTINDPNRPVGTFVPGSGYDWPVWGYIEPGDATDQSMHLDDWVAANTGVSNASPFRSVLNEHIGLGRVLRLLIWDVTSNPGNDGRYHISRFALFRLHGYNLSQGWILLEFIGWDESCGQTSAPLTDISITGPTTGYANISYPFTSTVAPFFASTPITTVWQIDGQPTITHTGGITDAISLSWTLTGTYTLTATAVNSVSVPVSDTHTIVIQTGTPPQPPARLYLPIILKP